MIMINSDIVVMINSGIESKYVTHLININITINSALLEEKDEF